MPAPRVFVSSTCYDLKYIRENLKYFIKSLGYEPQLSEDGNIFFNPSMHVQDSCIADIPNSQMFILIIGGRFGSIFKDTGKSITNNEYETAIVNKIPVFALIERQVFEQYRTYLDNKAKVEEDNESIKFSAVDSIKIFNFVEDVQSKITNNALVPFSDFEEMQSYLKQQWASMVYRYLTTESEAKRTSDILKSLTQTSEKIEFLSKQVLNSSLDQFSRIRIQMFDYIVKSQLIADFNTWGISISPDNIIIHETIDDYCENLIIVDNDEGGKDSVTYGGPPYVLSKVRFKRSAEEYKKIRLRLLKLLEEKSISKSEFLSDVLPSPID